MPEAAPTPESVFASYIKDRAGQFTGREWVFHRLQRWLADPGAGRFFHLIGEPGSGKTAIAARLAQFSSGAATAPPGCPQLAPGWLGAVHFCVARAATWIDPLAFARSVSLQLARANPRFALALKNAGDRSINIQVVQHASSAASLTGVVIENLVLTGLNAQAAFNAVVAGPLQEIHDAGADHGLAILVDGLDESLAFKGDIGIPQLLASLESIPSRLRVIVVSQPHHAIENELLRAERFFLSDQGNNASNEADVRSFVEASLAGTALASSAEMITRKADHNFQYVTFLLNHIRTFGPAAAENLPPGLHPLYSESLGRLIDPRQWGADFAPIMGLLSVARESLTQTHLRNFSGAKEREVSDRLVRLRPFIEDSGVPSTYRFFHQSVVEFLQLPDLALPGRSLPNNYYLPPNEWHERVAQYYVPNGPESWTRWDDYGIRYAASHLAEAARGESNGNSHALVGRLVGLVTNPQYRARYLRDVGDLPALQRGMLEAVQCASRDRDPGALVPLVRAAFSLRAFLDQELRPQVVFELAAAGRLEQAARRLELFDIDQDWARVALLIIAWIGADKNAPAARAILARVKDAGAGPIASLVLHVRAVLDATAPPVPSPPLDPPRQEHEIAGIVDWFGGKGGDPEMLQRRVNDSFINMAREMGAAVGYFAAEDAPALVSFAASRPDGDRYLHQYIAIHSGYQYVQYRNRSLWIVLEQVLRHPDPRWIRETAREITATALSGSTLEFRESLPLTILALQAVGGDTDAERRLQELRSTAIADAGRVPDADPGDSGAYHSTAFLWRQRWAQLMTHTSTDGDDSWGSHRRRLAAHAQLMARLDGDPQAALELLWGAAALKRGFAGFQAPTYLALAETALTIEQTDSTFAFNLLHTALRAAHNVQDASFCLRITSRCNAMMERWWNTGAFDTRDAVTLLAGDPRSPRFAAIHRVGEAFQFREPTGLPIPGDVRSALSLAALANLYHTPLSEMQRVNAGFHPDEIIPLGAPINIPDPGFATWLAARLSAQVLVDPALTDADRVELLQLLVPVASPNPTVLDTVISRLLLAARPDVEELGELARLVGPARIDAAAAFEARLPA